MLWQRIRPEHLDYLGRRVDLLLAAGAKLSDDGLSPCGMFYLLALEDRASAQASSLPTHMPWPACSLPSR